MKSKEKKGCKDLRTEYDFDYSKADPREMLSITA